MYVCMYVCMNVYIYVFRKHLPGAVRPARPERCCAAAFDICVTTSDSIPERYVSIRQHKSAYVSIREHMRLPLIFAAPRATLSLSVT
jgi:hypothetical protein